MRRLLAILGTLTLAGCAADNPSVAVRAMREADRFEVLSIDPFRGPTTRPVLLGDYPERGRVTIEDRATRDRLAAAFRAGTFQNDHGALACKFVPHHAIHLVRGTQTCDVVICFHCGQVQMIRSDGPGGWFFISRDLRPTFDAVLADAGVPLAGRDE